MEQDKGQQLTFSKEKGNLLARFLENALVEKYDATVGLIGKLFWPVMTLLLAVLFYSDISGLIRHLSANLSRTSKINIAGVEIEVYADSLRSSDLEAHLLLSQLSREDLLNIIELGELTMHVSPSDFTPEYEKTLDNLVVHGLIEINRNSVSIQNEEETVVAVKLTDMGGRVYRELQSVLIHFIEGIPSEIQ